MTDYFALLDEPRRPWIEPDSLKRKFFALSAEDHPDRVHQASDAEKVAAQQRYTELSAAYNCLREPKERLRHLLELERGTKPEDIQRIPSDLMDVFMEVSALCRETDAFLAEKAKTTSPLLKVRMFDRGQGFTEKLMALQRRVNSRQEGLVAELKAIDAAWITGGQSDSPGGNEALRRLEELYRLFSYFSRWSGQLQERIAQISF